MKILFVTPYFYPAEYFGGPIQAVLKLGKELVKRNHEVVVFTSDARDLKSRLKIRQTSIDGIEVHYLKNVSMLSATYSRLFITPELCKTLDSNLSEFDVAYGNEYTTFQNIMLHKFACQYKVPYVVQARGSIPKIGRTGRKIIFDMLFGRKLLKDAAANIALTRAEYTQYKKMGVPDSRITTIPNGVNLKEFVNLPSVGSFRTKFGIAERKKIILYLGRIHSIKGIDVLVKAFAYGKQKGVLENALLVIAGSDDGYLENLKRLVKNYNLSSEVVFTGPLYGQKKLAAYVDSHVVVMPSYYETFPNVALEAYGCSRCVIASNVESIADIVIDGETGLLFESGNSKALATKISFALSNPSEVQRMGANARRFVETSFSIDHVVDLFESLFKKIKADPDSL
ncbi:MAG: glycosyltransferase family 4 protein [Bacillota bacterium]|jgi:glycosyltransferase involved in cell wall biosynthesis